SSSGVIPATYASYSAFLTRLPSGVRSWTSSGSVLFFAVVRLVVRLVPVLLPVVPALPAALRRGVPAALLSTLTCAPPSVRPPGLPGEPVRLTCFRHPWRGVCATRPGTGVTGAPASALQHARYPVPHISVKPLLTCVFAWKSKYF